MKLALLFLALSLFAEEDQPLPYNHKTHVALGLKCVQCHVNPEPGDRMTFPATSKCMTCHTTVAKDRPAIRKLAAYAESKEPIPWVRLYAVAAGVYWSHRTHASSNCAECHGEVARMDVTVKARDVTTMGGCVTCHKQHKAATGCESCHEGK
jgi:hypothetical protein